MAEDSDTNLIALTAELVSAHVANNSIQAADLPALISSVYGALAGLGTQAEAPPAAPEHRPAVSIRKSLASDEHIISMIDGKPYKTLRRHLRRHGLDDAEYRARYNLPASYPMIAKGYSAARSAMAQAAGLGRKVGQDAGQAVEAVTSEAEAATAPVAEKARRGAKRAKAVVDEVTTAAPKRGRKPAC